MPTALYTPAHRVRQSRLTEETAAALDRDLAALDPGPDLVLDLSLVEFLSSMALARFVALDRAARAAGGRLTLLNVRPLVRQVLAVTRLDTVLDVRGVEAAAA